MAPELKEKLVSAVLEYHISSLKRTHSGKGYYIGRVHEDVERFFDHVISDVCFCMDIDRSYDGMFVKFARQALRNIILHHLARSIGYSYFIENEEKKREVIQAIIVEMRQHHFLDDMNFYYSSATEALLRLLYV